MIASQISKFKNITMKTKTNSQISVVRNHEFKLHFLKQPTQCSHCSTFVSGVGKQVYKCQNCQITCHTYCMPLLPNECRTQDNKTCLKTHFLRRTSKLFYICNHCGKFNCGVFQKCYKCSNDKCQVQIHSSCRNLVSQECANLSRSKYGQLVLNVLPFSAGTSPTIQIDVIEARNIIPSSKDGFSNPFCEFVLKSGSRIHATYTTDVQYDTLNPYFDDSIIFSVPNTCNIELHVTMYSKLRRNRKYFLGGMMLSLEDIRRYSTGSNISLSLLNSKLAKCFHHVSNPPKTDEVKDAICQDIAIPPSHSLTREDFSVITQVGEGGFGTVHLANLKRSQTRAFAIKVFDKQRIKKEDLGESLLVEHRIGLLAERPSFLAEMLASFQDKENYYMVFDFFGGGDLFYHISKEKIFPEYRTRFYVAEISIALFFLHKLGIAYLDLKLENLLLDNEGHIKLVDFGFCAEGVYNGRTQTQSHCGTLNYIAPEILAGKYHDCGADLWSLGVLVYEMMLGRLPFRAECREDLLDLILKESPRIPVYLSGPAQNFLTSLLKIAPAERLGYDFENGCEKFRSALFFSEIDWTKLENREVAPPFVPRLHSATATTYFRAKSETLLDSNCCSSSSLASNVSQVFNYTSSKMLTYL